MIPSFSRACDSRIDPSQSRSTRTNAKQFGALRQTLRPGCGADLCGGSIVCRANSQSYTRDSQFALIERALNWFEQIDRSQHFDSVSMSTRLALRSLLEFYGSKATQPMLSRPLI
jgi:hypothetical protein